METMGSPWEARVRQQIDEADVARVLSRVARAMDQKDWNLLAECYDVEAVGDYENGLTEGRAAILESAQGFLSAFTATQHLIGNVEVSVTGNAATSHATFVAQHVLETTEGQQRTLLGGTYDDELVRGPESWRISRRRIRGIWSDGDFAALLGHTA
ncbi:MAG: nuclear transport factor 2 family protein [Actinomycetes bacterium]